MKQNVSYPGQYEGYSSPKYNGARRFSQYVSMRDGTKIAVDYYRPTLDGVVAEEKMPVVWRLTPYGRSMYENGKVIPGRTFTEDQISDKLENIQWDIMVDVLTSYGYIVGYADCRGMKASYGVRWAANSVDEGQDGYEINEWFASQSFCDGNTGMFGSSYTGQTQLEVLRTCPPHLKAACVCMTDYNKYDGWVRGGIARAFGSQPDLDYRLELESAVPVDGDEERIQLAEAVEQHRFNGKQIPLFQNLKHRDDWCDQSDSEYWNQVSASTYKDKINSSNAAVYLIGGWFDVFRRDTVMMYHNITLPKKMIIGPWFHTKPKREISLVMEHVRFYDYWLKGIDNGIMDEDPIFLKCVNAEEGEDWGFAKQWPLPGEKAVRYYLHSDVTGTIQSAHDGSLSEKPYASEQGADTYQAVYDFEVGVETPDTRPLEENALTYTTEVVDKAMHLTGHGLASLWISCSEDDTDIFVTVSDIDEAGNSRQITDGHLRASKRKTCPAPYEFLDRPWNSGDGCDVRKLVPGKPYKLDVDLMPINYILKAGHRLRVSVTCAEKGFYYLQPEHGAEIQVYHNMICPSYLEMKVL